MVRLLLVSIVVWLGAGSAARAQSPTTATAPGIDASARPTPRDSSVVGTRRDPFAVHAAPVLDVAPILFPALIPVLDSELPPLPTVRDAIWSELMPYANELFYAPLSTRFAGGTLNRRHRQRLDSYRIARDGALSELRSALAGGDASVLETLRTGQDKLLADLVVGADALRRDLYRGGFAVSDGDWNQHRNWRLGDPHSKRTPQELLYDEFSVVRAAIYYQEGLAPEQRQLLREVVAELAEALGERQVDLNASFVPEHVIYFLPHGSRIRLPEGLPAEVSSEIARFVEEKTALKRELRDALFTLDRESESRREKALQELAERQAPRLSALEPLAEQIRRRLAGRSAPPAPVAHGALPGELLARIDAYLRDKAELQRAAQRQAEATPNRRSKPSASAGRAALAEFEERNRASLAALAVEARAIREEVARAAASSPEKSDKSVDALLADFAAAFKQQQLQTLYREYRLATLHPGLSPAQRQLLFDAAIAALDLPGVKEWQALPE
ncbi:MAG: hypothetical protein C0518_10160 [Opitutus sp.]|nr:hypothetical protein [Opitutus sp.]